MQNQLGVDDAAVAGAPGGQDWVMSALAQNARTLEGQNLKPETVEHYDPTPKTPDARCLICPGCCTGPLASGASAAKIKMWA